MCYLSASEKAHIQNIRKEETDLENELRQNWEKILEHMHTAFDISDVSFRTFKCIFRS